MSADHTVVARSWSCGRFVCTLRVPADLEPGAIARASIEWTPAPDRLSPSEVVEYRSGRAAAFEALALELGFNAVVEV